jgi:hypothetical protein
MGRILTITGLLLLLPTFSAAQHHGGMAAAGQAVVVAPHMVAPVHAGAPAHVVAGAAPHAAVRVPAGAHAQARVAGATMRANGVGVRTTRRNNGVRVEDEFSGFGGTSFQDVPGLGFDFPHMAAVNSGRRMREDGFFSPFGFSGFLLSSPSVIVEEVPVENQEPAVEEGAAGNANDVERGAGLEAREGRVRGAEGQSLAATNAALAPQHDAAEYVFVRRDGGLVFAVAYSWENGTLRYVTRDGMRRSVTRDALDMEATQQFNEQRGVNFRSPA